MRSRKELLQLLLDNIDLLESGLCHLIYKLYHIKGVISTNETINLEYFLYINSPTIREYGAYYWKKGDKEVRIEWLKNQISRLEAIENSSTDKIED